MLETVSVGDLVAATRLFIELSFKVKSAEEFFTMIHRSAGFCENGHSGIHTSVKAACEFVPSFPHFVTDLSEIRYVQECRVAVR
jgi:hypothetical protein